MQYVWLHIHENSVLHVSLSFRKQHTNPDCDELCGNVNNPMCIIILCSRLYIY